MLIFKSMQKSRPHNKHQNINIIFIILILLIAFIVLFFVLSPKAWNGKSKLAVISGVTLDNVLINVLDPANGTITVISIPANTEVEAANQLGTWKLGSIQKLGRDKNLGDDFLKNTIIKSFSFPIDSSESLSILDKIKIKLFTLSVGNSEKSDINLKDTSYLNERQLIDGTRGYEISGNLPPPKIESYFSENYLDTNQNVLINNRTGMRSVGNMAGKVIRVLGLNIASIQNLEAKDTNCKITGNETDLVTKIAKIFGCDIDLSRPANNFNMQVDLGAKFKARF
jgi:hypothetical protein